MKKKSRELNDAAGRAMSDEYGGDLKTYGFKKGWFDNFADRKNSPMCRYVGDRKEEWTDGDNAEGPSKLSFHYASDPTRDENDSDYEKYGWTPSNRLNMDLYNGKDYLKYSRLNKIGRDVDNFTRGKMYYHKSGPRDNFGRWKMKKE